MAITEEEVIPLAAKRLGFGRMTEELKQVLSDAVGQCIRRDMITHEGVQLKAV